MQPPTAPPSHAGRIAQEQRRLRSRIALYFRRGVTAVAAVAVVGLVWLLAQPASVPPIRDASGTVVPGSIASLEKVQINGSEQWIEIRAWSPDKPVLLSIPGGPGQSDLALSRPTLGTLAKDFVVVSWDQRGIGKSYASFDPTKLTTKQEVADTIALTNYLRKRFNEPKIYLFGESGGSVIGVLAVQQHPELYHAWIGSGQMVNPRETDRRIYHDLLAYAAKHHDTGLANKLHGYGAPPYRSVYAYGYVMTQYDKLAGDYTEPKAYTDALDNAGVGPFGVMGSEYTLPEKMNVLRGLHRHLLRHLPAMADDRLPTHRRTAPCSRLHLHRRARTRRTTRPRRRLVQASACANQAALQLPRRRPRNRVRALPRPAPDHAQDRAAGHLQELTVPAYLPERQKPPTQMTRIGAGE